MIQLSEADAKLIRSCLTYRLGAVEALYRTAHQAGMTRMVEKFKDERDDIIVLLATIEGGV
jgi:hypothetical protein